MSDQTSFVFRTRRRDFAKSIDGAMFKLDCWWIEGGFDAEHPLSEDDEDNDQYAESESATQTDEDVGEPDDPLDEYELVIPTNGVQNHQYYQPDEEDDGERTEEATLISEDSARAVLGSSCGADNAPLDPFEDENDEECRIIRDVVEDMVVRVDRAHTAIKLMREKAKMERREAKKKEREDQTKNHDCHP